MNQTRYMTVIYCGTCPNKVGMTVFGGNLKDLQQGLHINRCALTGTLINANYTPSDCPLPFAGETK